MSGLTTTLGGGKAEQLTFKRQACKELGLAFHVHLKVPSVDSAEFCLQTVLMYRQSHLLSLSDPYLFIQGQLLVANLVVSALLRCGVRMSKVASSLRSCLPVSPRRNFELVLFVTKLRLVMLHLVIASTRVENPDAALAMHVQVLLVDAIQDLLLLLRGGTHVIGDVCVDVIGHNIGRLNGSAAIELSIEQLLLS